MTAVQHLKANLKIAGKPCGWCHAALALGDDAAVCVDCTASHHRRCWDTRAGCSTAGCVHAPLHRLDAPSASGPGGPALPALETGMMRCPRCATSLPTGTQQCWQCKAITSIDGVYHGPRVNAPGAVKSLVYALVGLVICGIVAGPIAIAKSNAARRAIADDPTLSGGGLATAGMVIGIIDLFVFAVGMMVEMGHR